MAASGSSNVVARRAIDEISECSGETETPKYMKAFILQEISESRHLIRVLHDEVDVAKTALGQVNAMIAEMEAMNDPFEYADSLGCLRDSKRMMGWKIMGLNQRIEDTEGEIKTFEGHLTSWMQQSTQRVAKDSFRVIVSEISYDKLFDPRFVNDLRLIQKHCIRILPEKMVKESM
ncbi:hypothetical protein Tco_0097665 [Tanacetum coccineum]